MNCIRLLTRVIPYVHEKKDSDPEFDEWNEKFFWGKRRVRKHRPHAPVAESQQQPLTNDDPAFDEQEFEKNAAQFYEEKPLAEQLIDTAFKLMFYPGFTVPDTGNKSSYFIWEAGVGCSVSPPSANKYDNNRVEILRFVLALCSDCLYTSSSLLPEEGSRFLTYITTQTDRRVAMAIFCSLLNTTMNYSPKWAVPYDHVLGAHGTNVLITYSLQLLETLLTYPVPENATIYYKSSKNVFRHLCSKVHKPEDLKFVVDSFIKVLSQPVNSSFSYLPGSHQEVSWSTELIMLVWDLLQCNKKFKSYMIASDRMHEYLIILLYFIREKAVDTSKWNLVRLCSYELLYITADPAFAKLLSRKFSNQSIQSNIIQIPSFNGTFSDYLIVQLSKAITEKSSNINFMTSVFLNCIYNISPYTQMISYQAASALVHLCASISNPQFLFSQKSNHVLLETVLKSINMMIECNYTTNRNLIFLIMKNEHVFVAIQKLSTEHNIERLIVSSSKGGSDVKISSSYAALQPEENFVIGDDSEDEEENDDDGLRKKEAALDSSMTLESIESKRNPELSIIAHSGTNSSTKKDKGKGVSGKYASGVTSPTLSSGPTTTEFFNQGPFTPTLEWTSSWLPSLPLYTILSTIKHLKEIIPYFASQEPHSLESKLDPGKVIESISRVKSIPGVTFYTKDTLPAEFVPVNFVWTNNSLGWYESILWGCIFQAECKVTTSEGNMMMNSVHSSSPVGVWNSTAIRLFRLQETAPRGPSLLRPKGAVDAMADTVIQKIGKLRIP